MLRSLKVLQWFMRKLIGRIRNGSREALLQSLLSRLILVLSMGSYQKKGKGVTHIGEMVDYMALITFASRDDMQIALSSGMYWWLNFFSEVRP